MPRSVTKAKQAKQAKQTKRRSQVGLRSDFEKSQPVTSNARSTQSHLMDKMSTGFKFVRSGGLTNWGLELTVPFVNVGFPGTSSSSYSRMADNTNYLTGKLVNFFDNSTGSSSLSHIVQYLLSIFTKYTPLKMSFHYRAQCSTSSNEPLNFAYNIDPNHGATWGINTTYYPAAEGWSFLRDQQYGRSFAPWEEWDMPIAPDDVTAIGQKDLLTNQYSPNETNTDATYLGYMSSSLGVCSVKSRYMGSAVTFNSLPVYGVIYLKMTLKLLDMALSIPFALLTSVPHELPQGCEVQEVEGKTFAVTVNGLVPADELIETRRKKAIEAQLIGYGFDDDEMKQVQGFIRKAFVRETNRRQTALKYSKRLLDRVVEEGLREKSASTSSSNDEYEYVDSRKTPSGDSGGFRAVRAVMPKSF